jgi:DNA-binding beta-propeller fold protein YncE
VNRLVFVLAVLAVVAGCTSSSRPAAARPAPPRAGGLGCSTATTNGAVLTAEHPVMTSLPGQPFDAVGAPGNEFVFVSLNNARGGWVSVLRISHGASSLVRTVPLGSSVAGAFGMALTPDGRLLLVAAGTTTVVLSVAKLESGGGSPVTGDLVAGSGGGVEVAVSPDGDYVYVANQGGGGLSVFNLALALRSGFGQPKVRLPQLYLGNSAVGVAVSPDGSLIYVTTARPTGPYGRLWVIDAAKADTGAGDTAVLASVTAGCEAVRVAVSPDGQTVYVTAAESDSVLLYSASALLSTPAKALIGSVRVGADPVGIVLVDGGLLALVADSARGNAAGGEAVTVISTADARAHRPAIIGQVPAGLYPRDLAYDAATGQVLLANTDSRNVEEFEVPVLWSTSADR